MGLAVGNGGHYAKTDHPKTHYRPLSEIVARGHAPRRIQLHKQPREHLSGGFHPKDEIPLINGNLLKNSPLSCFQTFQDPESDRLKNSIKAIAQHAADQICNQVRDVRGAVEERL